MEPFRPKLGQEEVKAAFLQYVGADSTGDREVILAELEGQNPALASEVKSLLIAAGHADPLEQVFQLIATSERDSVNAGLGDTSSPTVERDSHCLGERVGVSIGPYKLLEQIGEGGMGTVYMAQQSAPLKRKVALKVVKPGMDTKEVIARFEAERQALALMDSPNIARVLDGGTTDGGRPYFVMELVCGLTITAYCDQARAPAETRLALFARVCRAVQHAHQKGIIHRDIKPSNVMVTLHDGEPVPKVIDFGVAKALNQQLTDKTVFTRIAQVMGTPLYMSPEQAELSGLDVDTRSDVYSLGVLLYELLTSTTPFGLQTYQQVGWDELRRLIREEQPMRPSHQVSTLGAEDRSTVSAHRSLDERKLIRLLRGDLDWIVMKALEKDRNRRYESAAAFAADIERFLALEPVEARPPATTYRLRRFARRNRTALAMAAVLCLAGLVVLGAVGWSMRGRALQRAGMEATAVAAMADSARHYKSGAHAAALAAARQAVNTLADGSGDETLYAEAQQRVRELETAAQLEELFMQGHGGSEENAAHAYRKVFRDYGLDPSVVPPAEFAEQIRKHMIRSELIDGLDRWATLQTYLNGPKDGLAVSLRSIAALADDDPWSCHVRDAIQEQSTDKLVALAGDIPVESASISVLRRLGLKLANAGRTVEAAALLRASVRRHPDDPGLNLAMFDTLRVAPVQTDRLEALGFLRASLAVRPHSTIVMHYMGVTLVDLLDRPEEGAEVLREVIRLQPDFTLAYQNLNIALRKLGRHEEAVAVARQAAARQPGIFSYLWLGFALKSAGQTSEAKDAYQQAVDCTPRSKSEHVLRGTALSELGQNDAAVEAFREAIRLWPDNVDAHEKLGKLLGMLGRHVEAEAALREALAAFEAPSFDWNRGGLYHALGLSLSELGRDAEAVDAYREAIGRIRDNDRIQLARCHRNLSGALNRLRRHDEAILACQEAIRLEPENGLAHFGLGVSLLNSNRLDEAVAAFRVAVRLSPTHAESHCNLGTTLITLGRFTEALAELQTGHELGSKDPKWTYRSDQWLETARRLVAIEPHLPLILAGDETPKDPADALAAAKLAMRQKRHVRAAELRQSALVALPTLAEPWNYSARYEGACAAALAGCAQGVDAHRLDEPARVAWRRKALDWLHADLDAKANRLLTADASERDRLLKEFRWWTNDADLAVVRDVTELAKLPEAERAEWQSLWNDVQSVLASSPVDKPAPNSH